MNLGITRIRPRAFGATGGGLALLVALVGCGGASGGLSRQALIARADAVCRNTDAQAAAASAHVRIAHQPDGPRQAFIKTALATLRISDHGLAQLRALRPPSSLAADWRRFVDDVQKEDAAGHALLRDARTQNTIAAAETQQSLQAVELDLQAVSERAGFHVCGKATRA